MIDYALAYAYSGFEVFPLAPNGKEPLIKGGGGLLDATTSPTVIKQWWRKCPQANIGIRVPERTIVIDIDPRSGGTLDQLGSVPKTRMARTGGGGWHLWFTYIGQARGKLGESDGIDIKSHSGYIVAPPSLHPDGGTYRWVDEGPIASLPSRLLWRVMPPPPMQYEAPSIDKGGSHEGLLQVVLDAQEGERNHKLFWAACRAYQEGADPVVLGELRQAGLSVGLEEWEVERTIRSACR